MTALRVEIEAEGRARIEAIRRDARERVARLRAEEDAAASERRARLLGREEKKQRDELARELAAVRGEGQRRVLEARDALLDRVFARARERLPEAATTPAAHERQARRAGQALAFVPPGEAVVECAPGVADAIEDQVAGRPGLRVETRDDLPTGFRISAAGGALTVDATLERLLELERPALAIEVLRRLEAKTP